MNRWLKRVWYFPLELWYKLKVEAAEDDIQDLKMGLDLVRLYGSKFGNAKDLSRRIVDLTKSRNSTIKKLEALEAQCLNPKAEV